MNQKKKMKPLDERRFAALLCESRWAALGTLSQGGPSLSWVAYVLDTDGALLLHLSRLAQHTRNMLAEPTICLSVSERDDGQCDPQTLARVTLEGKADPLDRASEEYLAAKAHYLERLPDAAMLFGFEDFSLFRFVPGHGHYVEGFGSTHRLSSEQLVSLLTR